MSLDDAEIEGWKENRKLVLSELRRMSQGIETINSNFNSELGQMNVKIAILQTKVALYAALAGGGTGVIVSIVSAIIVNALTKR